MNFDEIKVGQAVIFSPQSESYVDQYTLAGVDVGDKGVVKDISNEYGEEDIIVDFTTKEGVLVDGFYTTPEDIKLA